MIQISLVLEFELSNDILGSKKLTEKLSESTWFLALDLDSEEYMKALYILSFPRGGESTSYG